MALNIVLLLLINTLPSKNFKYEPSTLSILADLSQAPVFCIILLLAFSSAIGFFIGYRTDDSDEQISESLLTLSRTSTSPSQPSSLFQSPCCKKETPETVQFSPLFSTSSFYDLNDYGSFKKNFALKKILSETENVSVFLAEHKLDSKNYIIKRVTLSTSLNENLENDKVFQEINKITNNNLKHVSKYVTCWLEENTAAGVFTLNVKTYLYVQMEYISGKTFDEWLEGNYDYGKVIRAVKQIAKSIERLHSKGIFHGSITTDNIIIDSNDNVNIGEYNFTKCMCFDNVCLLGIIGNVLNHFDDVEKTRDYILNIKYIRKSMVYDEILNR